MKLPELTKRVRYWQERLASLGLAHWQIEVQIVAEPDDNPDVHASVGTSASYDTATIEFAEASLAILPPAEIDRVIIHELLHVLFRDYEEAQNSILYELHPGIRNNWSSRMDHELEGVVERLARTFIEVSTST